MIAMTLIRRRMQTPQSQGGGDGGRVILAASEFKLGDGLGDLHDDMDDDHDEWRDGCNLNMSKPVTANLLLRI
jgi:hypothetical protein